MDPQIQPPTDPATGNSIAATAKNPLPDLNSNQIVVSTFEDPTLQPGTVAPAAPTVINQPPSSPLQSAGSIKPKIKWPIFAAIGIAVVIIIGFGTLLATNYNLRATVFFQKLRQYSYVNSSGDKYSILFYKGAKLEVINKLNTLVAPALKPGALPLTLILSGSKNNLSTSDTQLKQEWKSDAICSNQSTYNVESFSLYVKSIDTTANVCTNPEEYSLGHIYFVSFIESSNALYFAFVEPLDCGNSKTVSNACIKELQATQVNVSDIKTILTSFKPLTTS